jgi:hypothetical protein
MALAFVGQKTPQRRGWVQHQRGLEESVSTVELMARCFCWSKEATKARLGATPTGARVSNKQALFLF